MRENKLLHYNTYKAFDDDRKNGMIADTSIAFVDEGRIIYTWGKEYTSATKNGEDIDDIDEKIQEAQERVDNLVDEWEQHLDEMVELLRTEALTRHNEILAKARTDLAWAQELLNNLRNLLDGATESWSSLHQIDIDELEGRITAITNYFNVQELSLVELQLQLDALNGKIITTAQYTQLATETALNIVNAYKREVDIKLAQLQEELSHINVDEATETVIGRLMDAENGVLKDYATKAWVGTQIEGFDGNVDVSHAVETYMNALDPSWSTVVLRLVTVENSDQLLSSQISRLWIEADKLGGITTSLDNHSSRIAALELSSGSGGAAVTLSAIYDALHADNTNADRIAAEIFLRANADGSNITLKADKIDLSGDTTVLGSFIANKINASSITASALSITSNGNTIKINGTNGIKHYKTSDSDLSSFLLGMDGSGHIGYTVTGSGAGRTITPIISWDSNGQLALSTTFTSLVNGESTSNLVQQVLNAMDPSYSTLVSSVSNNTSRIASLEVSTGANGSTINLQALYDIIHGDTSKSIAAEIFLQANANGSNISIKADKIDLTGDTTVLGNFIAQKIAATDITANSLTISNSPNTITIDNNGIIHANSSTSRNSFKLNADGSGQLGYVTSGTTYLPAIEWSNTGLLSLNSKLITMQAVYDAINGDSAKLIAAKIFLQANASGSSIKLDASQINLTGDTTVLGNFIAQKINATDIDASSLTLISGNNKINIDATNGIRHTNTSTSRNSFKLNLDGSGSLGYVKTGNVYSPALTWGTDGVLTVNSGLVVSGYDDTSLTNRVGALESTSNSTETWKSGIDSWKSGINTWKNSTATWMTGIEDWQTTLNTWKSNIDTWKAGISSSSGSGNSGAYAYLGPAGIIFDNMSAQGQVVAVTSTSATSSNAGATVPAGVSHTRISDGKHGYYLKNDGTGELAFGNISWNNDGVLNVKDITIDTKTSVAGSEYNLIDFYKWDKAIVPLSTPQNGMDFIMADVLSFRIVRNGFVVRDRSIEVPMQYDSNNYISAYSKVANLPYNSVIGVYSVNGNDYVSNYSGNVGYNFTSANAYYDFHTTNVNKLSIVLLLKRIPAQLFKEIFAINPAAATPTYFFDNNDDIEIHATNEYTYKSVQGWKDGSGRMQSSCPVKFYTYISGTGGTYSYLSYGGMYNVANTSDTILEVTAEVILETLEKIFDSSTATRVFNALFTYSDNLTSAKNAAYAYAKAAVDYGGVNNVPSGISSAAETYRDHALNMAIDLFELEMAVSGTSSSYEDWEQYSKDYKTSIESDLSNGTLTRGKKNRGNWAQSMGGWDSYWQEYEPTLSGNNETDRIREIIEDISDAYYPGGNTLLTETHNFGYVPTIEVKWSELIS